MTLPGINTTIKYNDAVPPLRTTALEANAKVEQERAQREAEAARVRAEKFKALQDRITNEYKPYLTQFFGPHYVWRLTTHGNDYVSDYAIFETGSGKDRVEINVSSSGGIYYKSYNDTLIKVKDVGHLGALIKQNEEHWDYEMRNEL